jgi:uncharacterized protein
MPAAQGPLSPEESEELASLLESAAGRSLAFARGVFAAVATAPTRLEPTDWVPLLLANEPPDVATLKRLFALLQRECAACVECLELRVPAVPSPDDAEGIAEFCKGYTRVSQGDSRWTRDADAFALTVPFAWLAGYVDDAALATFAADAAADPAAFRALRHERLADDVARLYEHWADARREPPPPVKAPAKIGRNEPCPCGSGKKYKKCCAV